MALLVCYSDSRPPVYSYSILNNLSSTISVSLRPHFVLSGLTLNMLPDPALLSSLCLCYCVSVSKSLLLLFSGCSSLQRRRLLLFTLTEWSLTSEDIDTLDAVLPLACLCFFCLFAVSPSTLVRLPDLSPLRGQRRLAVLGWLPMLKSARTRKL